MSAYIPPIEDLPIFNPAVFTNGESQGITLSEADARYVKKSGSIMTGQLTVPSVNITNALTLNSIDVETKLDEIDTNTSAIATNTSNIATNTSNISTNASNISTNTSNISTNTTDIASLKQKTTDLSYNSSTNTSTFSNTSDVNLNIVSGSLASYKASLNFYNGSYYKGGINSSSNGLIIKSNEFLPGNFPPIVFTFEDAFASDTSLEITENNITTYKDILPASNGVDNIGSISKFFLKIYSQDIQTSNHSSIDTVISTNTSNISTNTSNISTNTSNISTLQNITQFQSSSGSGGSSKTTFTNAQTEIKSNYTTYLLIKGDEDNSSSTEGAYLQFYTGTAFQSEIGSDRNSLILKSYSSSSVKPIYIKFVENGSITYTAVEFNELNSIFNNNVIPNITSTNTLGSATKYWNHGYINNISTSSYPDLNSTLGGIATNASNISTNASNIATNTSNIATNTSNIATNTSNISTNTSNISTNSSAITALETKTQDLTYSSGNYYLATNLFEITAGNSGDCILRLRADQDNNNENDNPQLIFSQDGTGDSFKMAFNNNSLEFISYYGSSATNDNFAFYTNTTILKLKIGSNIVCNASIIPNSTLTYNLGSGTNYFNHLYVGNISTSSFSDLNSTLGGIATNSANISTNASNIATNTSNIATNTSNISTNSSAISTLEDNTQAISYEASPTPIQSTNSSAAQTDIDSNLFVKGGNIWLRGSGDNITNRLRFHHNDSNAYIDWEGAGSLSTLNFRYDTTTKLVLDSVSATYSLHIVPNATSTYRLGSTIRYFSHGYIDNISTSSFSDLNNTLTSINSNIASNDVDITALQGKTQYQSINSGRTAFSTTLYLPMTTKDTTIDWGLIDNRQPNVNGFIPKIEFYEGVRNMYIGVVTESDSTRGIGVAVNAGSGNDPNMSVYFCSDMTAYFYGQIITGDHKPATDANRDLGSSSLRWDALYIDTSPIITSDLNKKNSIESLDETEMTNFIKALHPVRYKFTDGIRYHCGLIAQEVQPKMPFDWGVYIEDTETQRKALRYTELISPIISTIQHLIKENEKLKKENEDIKNRLDIIEQLLGI